MLPSTAAKLQVPLLTAGAELLDGVVHAPAALAMRPPHMQVP